MTKQIRKILVLATSPQTKGGISYVIKEHQLWDVWDKYQIKWIATHIDKSAIMKLIYFLKALCIYLLCIPKYDLIHIHTSEPASIIRKLPFFLIARLCKKKIVIHFHSFSPTTTIEGKYAFIYKYMFGHANRVIVLSDKWKKIVNEKFHIQDKLIVIYNPCQKGNKGEFKRKQILYAGALNQRKGYADLLNAYAPLSKEYPDWRLFFAGNGEIEQAATLSKKLQIEDKIVIAGWLDGDRKRRAFQESTIFCLPSYAEGFPMAVLDAWSYGLPVITTPVGGLADVIIPEKNALVFEPGNVLELRIQLKKLLSDEMLRIKLSKESTQLATSIFDATNINKQLDILYMNVLAEKI